MLTYTIARQACLYYRSWKAIRSYAVHIWHSAKCWYRRRSYRWIHMVKDVREGTMKCLQCKLNCKKHERLPLIALPLSSSGNQYLLWFFDHHLGWVRVKALLTKHSFVILKFVNKSIHLHLTTNMFLTGNGSQVKEKNLFDCHVEVFGIDVRHMIRHMSTVG